jgi:predicted GIY-YIG superfamily endonuclease
MQYVYILRSLSRKVKTYVGCTNDLKMRLRDHNGGIGRITLISEIVSFIISLKAYEV